MTSAASIHPDSVTLCPDAHVSTFWCVKLSVRLTAEEEQIVRGLKRRRVNVSALVRRSLHEAAKAPKVERSAVDILDDILRKYPTPTGTKKPSRPPLDDRRAIQAFIRRRLKR